MSIQISTRIDKETKERFDKICNEVGLTPSGALSVFIKGVINHNGIPFSVTVPQERMPKMSREEAFGYMHGQFNMAGNFDAPLEDFKEYME